MADKEKQIEWQKKYEKEKRAMRSVSFNRTTEQDLLAFVDKVNFSQWVKAKIREELEKQ
ncbi:hypothetical protein [Bergeriella denitrificans]|uniref:Uncharacterized protein n=1 Tax=Bergeriella denitrificans TaxID=494 RepID=A0A378UI23_BERDE|nr:hypothetical protein [Bergeriella denitrificans]STZ76339.1 Uncharacterised protein [Bergeriella denitrificans]